MQQSCCHNLLLLLAWSGILTQAVRPPTGNDAVMTEERKQGVCDEMDKQELLLQQLSWKSLGELYGANYIKAMQAIGYDELKWNSFVRMEDETKAWLNLTEKQRGLLEQVGYSQERWDCDVDYEQNYPSSLSGSLPSPSLPDIPGKQSISITTSDDEGLTIGALPNLRSQLLASVVGRLFTGYYGLEVKIEILKHPHEVHDQMKSEDIDLLMDAPDHDRLDDAITDYGASWKSLFQIYAVKPINSTLPYFQVMANITDFWSTLNLSEYLSLIPKGNCSMGPWADIDATEKLGVWCLEPGILPMIWAMGPPDKSSDFELMSFIRAKSLKVGVEFLEASDFDRRVRTAVQAGAPGLAYLCDPSVTFAAVADNMTLINMPVARHCGTPGSAYEIGNWVCGARELHTRKLGSLNIDNNKLLRDAIESFKLDEDDSVELFSAYLSEFDRSKNQTAAVHAAANSWVLSHESKWKDWFQYLPSLEEKAVYYVVGFLSCGMLAYLLSEALYWETAPEQPDSVDRSKPTNAVFETLAGSLSTLSILMDAVGVASIIMAADRLVACRQAVLMHVMLGQFVGQSIVCVFSNLETPILTSSLELLPFIAMLMKKIEEATVGRTPEYVLATLLALSMFMSILSGLIMYLIGKLKLGGMLRYLPFSVKTGVQAGMGIVLLSLGLELCCDESFLGLSSKEEFLDFFGWDTASHWLPGFVSALVLFIIGTFIVDSPYTILIFFVVSVGGIHVVRVQQGQSLNAMAEDGWLFEPVEAGTVLSVWAGLQPDKIVWSVISDNWSTVLLGCFVAPVLNNVGDLAVIKSVLPPKVIGESDFNWELLVQGRAHVLLGLVGGFSSDYGNDDTIVHRKYGGSRRLSMYVHCFTLGVSLVFPSLGMIIPYIPKFANGSVIALAGFEFMYESLVVSYSELKTTEYAVVLLFSLLVLATGGAIEQAILVGTFLGFTDFIVRYASLDQVSFVPSQSSTTYAVHDEFRLNFCGLRSRVVTAKLRGYLFFASAPSVLDELLAKVEESVQDKSSNGKVIVIVDWAEVPDIDTAAGMEFERLDEAIDRLCGLVIFSSMNLSIEREFRRQGFLAPVPEELEAVWPETKQRLGREECVELLDGMNLEDSVSSNVVKRLISSASMSYVGALLRAAQASVSVAKPQKSDSEEADADENSEADGEDDSDEEEGTFLMVDTLDQAYLLAEQIRLTRTAIGCDTAAVEQLLFSQGELQAGVRFRQLCKALAHVSPLSALLREIATGGTKSGVELKCFREGEVILTPKAKVSAIHMLLFGSVVAMGDDGLAMYRHTDRFRIFGEESMMPDVCFTLLGYRAASSCMVLTFPYRVLSPDQQAVLLKALNRQQLSIKQLHLRTPG
eukprot:TRINITY_DN49456_c0_g1_i1.p1 TRINITY_DN49456_c0_g1~~TRINITY_DN49456_c0_g1_i1.p1  ORF type:complete len:1362 (+),score=223.97 TRINITY_DN49456_c0_g1_i1:123-4208(+)